MFALTGISSFTGINLKVDPEVGVELREQYSWVLPGYHMNKRHWITIDMTGAIKEKLLKSWIDNSYNLVVAKLPKSIRLSILWLLIDYQRDMYNKIMLDSTLDSQINPYFCWLLS